MTTQQGWRLTMEFRNPRKGEWYVDNYTGAWKPRQAARDMEFPYLMLRPDEVSAAREEGTGQ